MLKAILFDLDGVLIETEKETFNFYQDFLQKNHNIILKDEDFKFKAGRKSKDFFNDILTEEQQNNIDIKKLTELKRELFNSNLDKYVKKINGGKDVIKKLKQKGYKLALVSQNEPRMIENSLNWLGIKEYFDIILSLDDISNKKPHPEIYQKACDKLNMNPSECIVIEDSADGINAAKNGNFYCIALKHDYMPEGTYDNADKVINNLEELLDNCNQ